MWRFVTDTEGVIHGRRVAPAGMSVAVHSRKLLFWKNRRRIQDGSVIIITGASSGIGRELALKYAQRNCRLVLAARSKNLLDEVAKECRVRKAQAKAVVADVTNEADCKNIIDVCIKEYGIIDVLILNAGVGCHHEFATTPTMDVYHRLMAVNFYGYLYCTHAAYPHLQRSKGQIVVVSSLSAEMGLPFRTAYCASKFATTGFFEALRAEMEASGKPKIYITIVCPPSVKTNLRLNSMSVSDQTPISTVPDRDAISVSECADVIMEAADLHLRKVFFPLMTFLGVYARPFLPDIVDALAIRKSRL